MVGTASAQIAWYLDSSEGAAAGVYKAWKGTGVSAGTDVSVDTSGEIWTADEAAECDVTFPSKTWTGAICRNTNESSHTYKVYIGRYDGSSFHSEDSSEDVTISNPWYCNAFSIDNANAFTVPNGEWLALKVAASGGTDVIEVETGDHDHTNAPSGGSVLYPESEPAWPYPELSTLVLLSVGLLALMSFVVLRKRKTQ